MNYYSVLGLQPGADNTEVKRAYKKLASKHHPDKGGDPEQFKRIQEAYDKINSGQGNQPEWQPFNQWEDFGQQRQQSQRNPDDTVDVRISLSTAYSGTDMLVNSRFAKELIVISPGVRDGTKLRIPGKGFTRFKHVPPGDLVVRIHIDYPAGVSRDQDTVYQRITVDAITAMVGGSINVTHFTGKTIKIKIPAGTQHGSKLRVPQWGMPNPLTKVCGDLLLVSSIHVPKITDHEVVELLNKLK